MANLRVLDIVQDDDEVERKLVDGLMLCFLACQNRSLFASKCLVETLLEFYKRGYTIDEMKLALTLASLTTGSPAPQIMQDVMLAWTSTVMLTMETVGVEMYDEVRLYD